MNELSPLKSAYISLKSRSRLCEDSHNKEFISFEKFSELMKENKVVNSDNSRSISKYVKNCINIGINLSSDSQSKENQTKELKIYEKAYQLGLINKDDQLLRQTKTSNFVISSYNKNSKFV